MQIENQAVVNISKKSRSLEIDTGLYDAILDEQALSNEVKREFLISLWTIISAFVDLGYGVHPIDLSENDRGEFEKNKMNYAAE